MSLLVATAAYLFADIVYWLVRFNKRFPTYRRVGHLIESALVAPIVVGWAWFAAPLVFDTVWVGVAGLLIYGLVWLALYLVTAFSLDWTPPFPLGKGGLIFIGYFVLIEIVDAVLVPGLAGQELADLLTIPWLVGGMLSVFVGTYDTLKLNDLKLLKEWSKSPAGPSSQTQGKDGSTGDITPTQSSPDSAAGNSATKESPRSRPSSSKSPPQSQLRELTYDWRYSPARFDDIGGYNDVKTALRRRIIDPLQRRGDGDDRYSRFGIEPERGIVLYGPPGTGKTLFARALAGELTVPFVELSPADVTSMWINESSDQVKVLFDEAQELGPCVIFLDEAEHLFGGRDFSGRSSHAEDRKVTSEFLAQLSRENREAIVVAATNRPDDIDPAILRPGRLSEHFEIGLPDEESRAAILQTHLEDVPTSISDADYAELASRTAGLTGADLANLVEDARWNAANRDARTLSREDFPTNSELEAMVGEFESEPDDLPDPDEDGADHLEDVDVAARSKNNDESDDSPVGYQ
jgi:AAA+ superfamily predicted ATPase